MRLKSIITIVVLAIVFATPLHADPCGMVPPIIVTAGMPAIERVGLQKTYVFYKDGIETFVIRPGYKGSVDQFGMLIPFPTPPAIRKVSDDIFAHVAAAVDPPEVVVDLRPMRGWGRIKSNLGGVALTPTSASESDLAFKSVKVLREEAVGMYEVAVLQAGSSAALKKWMDDHGFKYPDGMDKTCDEYVEIGWCFVAVKTKVGQKAGVNPRPGLRNVDSKLPSGATFDGNVQAMGFRFKTDEFVLPMRLAAFNAGELRNVVYVLSDHPTSMNDIPTSYVVRQLDGRELYRHLTRPLPLRVIGGRKSQIPQAQLASLKTQRIPAPHNGLAFGLIASDLLAARTGELSHDFEEYEKELLRIGERLGLRGAALDAYHQEALAEAREEALKGALKDIRRMTLTVIDGDFPREVMARENLTFASYTMPRHKNRSKHYDAKQFGPAPTQEGRLYEMGALDNTSPSTLFPIVGALLLGFVVVGWRRHESAPEMSKRTGVLVLTLALGATFFATTISVTAKDRVATLIEWLGEPEEAAFAVKSLAELGDDVINELSVEATNGDDFARRGWAIVCLSEIATPKAAENLRMIYGNGSNDKLIRTWAAAAHVRVADNAERLVEIANYIAQLPPIGRPLSERILALQSVDGGSSVEDLLRLSNQLPQLQGALAESIVAGGADPLVETMLIAADQTVRRMAAGYLGTLATQGDKGVASAVIDGYWFDRHARNVPWRGGPLYVPALGWEKDDAQALSRNLIQWLVFCDRKGLDNEMRQIHNNLASVQLSRAAGYGFSRSGEPRGWYASWGQANGREALEMIFEEQGVASDERFRRILKEL